VANESEEGRWNNAKQFVDLEDGINNEKDGV